MKKLHIILLVAIAGVIAGAIMMLYGGFGFGMGMGGSLLPSHRAGVSAPRVEGCICTMPSAT